MDENIMVAIRARPISEKEKRSGDEVTWRIEDSMIVSTIHELEIAAAASAAFAKATAAAAASAAASSAQKPSSSTAPKSTAAKVLTAATVAKAAASRTPTSTAPSRTASTVKTTPTKSTPTSSATTNGSTAKRTSTSVTPTRSTTSSSSVSSTASTRRTATTPVTSPNRTSSTASSSSSSRLAVNGTKTTTTTKVPVTPPRSTSSTSSRTATTSSSSSAAKTPEKKRPTIAAAKESGDDNVVMPGGLSSLATSSLSRVYSYTFDHIFGPSKTTQQLYETVGESLVWSSMDGYNATVFAYGQTGSGKTYTMKGILRRAPGFIPLAIQDVFAYIAQSPEREFLLRVSYFEIYNEVINDLLDPTGSNLTIREDPKKGTYVDQLKEEIVMSPDQMMSLLSAGESHRHVGATDFNLQSSRSHTIFRLVIESRQCDAMSDRSGSVAGPLAMPFSSSSSSVRVSYLNLIDLAGSEKASQQVTEKQLRQKEGSYINKSLLTLGNVISKLSSRDRKSKVNVHIPFRDSKLTRILEASLSGNAKICIICTINLSTSAFEETNNTLKFAQRAKFIKNSAVVNEYLDDKSLIRRYREEIDRLKRQLEAVSVAEDKLHKLEILEVEKEQLEHSNLEMKQRLQEQEEEKQELEERISRLSKLILSSTTVAPSHGHSKLNQPHSASSSSSSSSSDQPPQQTFNPFSMSSSGDNSGLNSSDEDFDLLSNESELKEEIIRKDSQIELFEEKVKLMLINETRLKEQLNFKQLQLEHSQKALKDLDDQLQSLIKLKGTELPIEIQLLQIQQALESRYLSKIQYLESVVAEKQAAIESFNALNAAIASVSSTSEEPQKDDLSLLSDSLDDLTF